MRELSRLAAWGLSALGALTIATYAASFDVAEERLARAVASLRGAPQAENTAATTHNEETEQLASTVRELTADRDQLVARLDIIERNVGDITSSISRASPQLPAVQAPAPAEPPPTISAPAEMPASVPPPSTSPPAPPSAQHGDAPLRAEFGIDLGRASTVDGLRQLWTDAKARHGNALEGLRPLIAVREIGRPGSGIELRLVVGPLANAATAARLCVSLSGVPCHPTVFDGQRLALR